MSDDTFLLRMRSDRLAPEIQAGDTLEVRETDKAPISHGGLVVIAGDDYEARVDRYDGTGRVIGIVTRLFRRID